MSKNTINEYMRCYGDISLDTPKIIFGDAPPYQILTKMEYVADYEGLCDFRCVQSVQRGISGHRKGIFEFTKVWGAPYGMERVFSIIQTYVIKWLGNNKYFFLCG